MRKRLFTLMMSFIMAAACALPVSFSMPAKAAKEDALVTTTDAALTADSNYDAVEGKIADIQKYGNLVLDIPPKALMDAGYTYGDLLLITVNEAQYSVPFGTSYSDVDTGNYILRHVAASDGEGSGQLILAINMGDFATDNKIAVKVTDEDKNVTWNNNTEGTAWKEMAVSIAMQEKEGYLDEYNIHQLTRTNDREDYASNAEFANFRNVTGGSLGANAFYRSSSPIDNQLKRAAYADKLSKNAGINAFINLANSTTEIESFIAASDFHSPYYVEKYRAGNVEALGLGVDFKADGFKEGMAKAISFIAAKEGPYLVHCTEGKDRAGFTSALIEMLMEVPAEEIINDYLVTYSNYYHIKSTDVQYAAVRRSNIEPILRQIAGVDTGTDLKTVDLKEAAIGYLTGGGLDRETIDKAIENLSKDYDAPQAPSTQDMPFADNNRKDEYFYIPITWGYIYDVTNGTSADAFGVGSGMKRGDFVVLLYRMIGAPAAKAHPFTDVRADYQNDAISWAYENSYVGGYSEELFGAEDDITRGQAVSILYRIAKEPETTADTSVFEDVPEGAYYANAVAFALSEGITKGISETSFAPEDTCKREQMITFIYRAKDLLTAE